MTGNRIELVTVSRSQTYAAPVFFQNMATLIPTLGPNQHGPDQGWMSLNVFVDNLVERFGPDWQGCPGYEWHPAAFGQRFHHSIRADGPLV